MAATADKWGAAIRIVFRKRVSEDVDSDTGGSSGSDSLLLLWNVSAGENLLLDSSPMFCCDVTETWE